MFLGEVIIIEYFLILNAFCNTLFSSLGNNLIVNIDAIGKALETNNTLYTCHLTLGVLVIVRFLS